MPNYSNWPVQEFERRFYKEVILEGLSFLAPTTKLGQGQSIDAEKARREAARLILSDAKLLASVRKQQADNLNSQIEAVKLLIESSEKEEMKTRYSQVHVSLLAKTLLPADAEPTDEDCDYYIDNNRQNDDLHRAWTAALYIPISGCPPIEKIYKYIPAYILRETQRFFFESLSEQNEKLNETPLNSEEDAG